MSLIRDFRGAIARSRAPVTSALVGLIAASFVLGWFRVAPSLYDGLKFRSSELWAAPWSLVSFPFVVPGILVALFACLWLWGVGGFVEREDGSARFLALWLIACALSGLGLYVGSLATGIQTVHYGPWTPVAAITIVWGTRHPDLPVNFMFVLNITARWVAWISAALVFFSTEPPQMAPFAGLPLLLAYLYAARKLPWPRAAGSGSNRPGTFLRGAGQYREDYFAEVKRREKERAERERLRRLFESSVEESDEHKP